MTMSRTACLLAVAVVLLALNGAAAQSAYQAVISGEPTRESVWQSVKVCSPEVRLLSYTIRANCCGS